MTFFSYCTNSSESVGPFLITTHLKLILPQFKCLVATRLRAPKSKRTGLGDEIARLKQRQGCLKVRKDDAFLLQGVGSEKRGMKTVLTEILLLSL